LIQTPQATPTPATAPVVATGVRDGTSASAIYQGFQAQRRELTNQLNDLQGTRESISDQLQETPSESPEAKVLQTRLTDVDQRISSVDQMLATNSMQLAQAAAVPGAVVEPRAPIRDRPPQEAWVLGGMFIVFALFPLSIAFARRIWRRSAAVVTSLPREFADRMSRMEQTVEATAVEVERIGEGQRFLTRLFTEGEGGKALGVGAAQPIQQRAVKSRENL
jgi:hypothetical protein